MLPDFLQSSFLRYKQDTDAVATWLAVKAKQHGYPVDQPPVIDGDTPTSASKRLKGKARKTAREGKSQPGASTATNPSQTVQRYTIKIRDFVALAEFIAGYKNPVIKVPLGLVRSLNRAIELRAQHNDWSRQSGSGDDPEARIDANATHSYFLGVLQRVHEVLKPRMPVEQPGDSTSSIKDSHTFDTSDGLESRAAEGLTNMFGMLELEEPSQAFLNAPGLPKQPENKTTPAYQAETDQSQEEKYLASHCLFQDIRHIRSFVRQLWVNFKELHLSLISVSVATNTAIALVRDMEEEFMQRFPGTSGYQDVLGLFYPVQCLLQGEKPDAKERPDDLFNFKVYDLAEDCLLTTFTTMSSLQDVIRPDNVPVYKPGHFGFRDRSKDWDDMTPRGKFKEDQLTLFEAFPDLVLLGMITSRSPLAEDELLRGVRDMLPGRPIPVWLVFAGRCFLDAQHILGRAAGLGLATLTRFGESVKMSVKETLTFHKSLRIENWPKCNDFQFTELLGIIDSWIIRDVVNEKREKVKMSVRLPSPDPFFLLKQYPLMCGLFEFAVKVRYQDLSLTFANAWGSIMYAGHLYNAVRQEDLLGRVWKDMELAIMLQSPEVFFVGNSPSKLEEYDRRFMLAIGLSATAFASNRRKNAPKPSAKGPRCLKNLGPVHELFAGRYCNNDRGVAFTPGSIKLIVEGKLDNDHDNTSDGGQDLAAEREIPLAQVKRNARQPKTATSGSLLRRRKKTSSSIQALDFLEDITNALHAEGFELSMDYLLLHRTCWRMLRNVNEKCKAKLLEIFGCGYLEKESQLPFVVGYIFMAATNTSKLADFLLPKRKVEVTSKLLSMAAEAMEEFFVQDGDDTQVQALIRNGYNINPDELEHALEGPEVY
ncbi:MAG: hypothetical protein Q9219_004690 [cf. Caloplaca sp. 3 TL-2023]